MTTVTVRDPARVRVEVDDGKGLRALLPPSTEASDTPVPDTSPPFHEGLRMATKMARITRGAVEVTCRECDPDTKTLVPLDGVMTLGESFHVDRFDFSQPEMRVHFVDAREGRYGNPSVYEADVVTPWTNVSLVRRVSTPNRALGVRLLLSAAVAAALGGLALGEGVGDGHPVSVGFGAVILPIAAVLAVSGGWYSFAPADDHILFRGH